MLRFPARVTGLGRWALLPSLALLVAALPWRPVAAAMAPEAPTITLGIAADRLTFSPDGRRLLLTATAEDRVVLFDLAVSAVAHTVNVPHEISDLTIAADGVYAYLLGPSRASAGIAMISRLSLADGAIRTLAFERELDRASIALSPDGQLYGGNFLADSLRSVPAMILDEIADGQTAHRSVVEMAGREISLKSGPAGAIEVAPGGRHLFVSHALERAVSAIDLETGRPIDQVWLETRAITRGSYPLQLVVTSSSAASSEQATASVAVGDYSGRRLVVLDLDDKFSSFEIIQTINLDSFIRLPPPRDANAPSPLLIAADNQQDTILVGSQLGNDIAVFSRTARTLEIRNTVQLPFLPDDFLYVSPSGDVAAFVGDGGQLFLMDNPGGRGEEPLADEEVAKLRDVQRWLSTLGYSVGLVDGMYGAQTRAALLAFQEKQGLKPTGRVDDAAFDLLRQAAQNAGGKSKGALAE